MHTSWWLELLCRSKHILYAVASCFAASPAQLHQLVSCRRLSRLMHLAGLQHLWGQLFMPGPPCRLGLCAKVSKP